MCLHLINALLLMMIKPLSVWIWLHGLLWQNNITVLLSNRLFKERARSVTCALSIKELNGSCLFFFFYSEKEIVGYSEDKSQVWQPNHNLLTRLQPHLSRVFSSKNDNVFLESPNCPHILPVIGMAWSPPRTCYCNVQGFPNRGAWATWGS